MKNLITTTLFLFIVLFGFAQEKETKRKLGLYASMDFQSESVWLGWDIGNNKAAYVPFVSLDLWQTGFKTAFWASMPMDRGSKEFDDFELFLMYNNTQFKDTKGEFNFHGFIDYIRVPGQDQFPHQPKLIGPDNSSLPLALYEPRSGLKQLWKFNIGISFNKLIPVGNTYIVPSYDIYYITPANTAFFQPGSVHDLSFAYKSNLGSKVGLNISNHTLYHRRLFEVTALAANYTTTILSYPIANGLSLNGQVSYQFSFEDMVNPEDEFWYGIGLSYSL